MNTQEESNARPARTQKLIMAAFLVVLVVTCIFYSSAIFGSSDEDIAELPQMEELTHLPPPPPVVELKPHDPAKAQKDGEIFMVVEQMPKLIGGLRSIQQNIKYPELAKSSGIEGRVFIQFIVDEEGNVQDPVVVKGIGGGCDEEAVRAVSQAKFNPGVQRGQAVKVKMSLPITFKLA